jgi:hypothetical protein
MNNEDLEQKHTALETDFIETDEMADYYAFIGTVRNAVEEKAETVTVPLAFLSKAIDDFQPLNFPHLREVYNALCDKHGLPDQKRPVAQPREGSEDSF